MGYIMTIVEYGLRCEKDINEELQELNKEDRLYLPWDWSDGFIRPDEGYFKWNDNFIKDLLFLKALGVSGHITCYGEEGEYYKYIIDDSGVNEYYGSVRFSQRPEKIIKSEDDLKKFEF